MNKFAVRIHGENADREIEVQSGVYMVAAAAVPAMFGIDLPVDLSIWSPDLIPEYGPYHYRIEDNEFGQMVVKHLVVR